MTLAVSGCVWPFSGGRVRPAPPAEGVSVEFIGPDSSMQAGGKIYFMPLAAGADAEAGEALDRLALMIIKGFADALAGGGKFVLTTDNDADMVVIGHIDEFRTRGRFKKTASLKVTAELHKVNAGAGTSVVARIHGRRQVPGVKKDIDRAAYDIGYGAGARL